MGEKEPTSPIKSGWRGHLNGCIENTNTTEIYAAKITVTLDARTAHDAFKLAEANKHLRRADWDDVKIDVMRQIIRAKAAQHEYVRRKLLATGDRELVENSWRDSYWGWGPNQDGLNMLGKLWMELRAGLREAK